MTSALDLQAAFQAYQAKDWPRAEALCAAVLKADKRAYKAHQLRALVLRSQGEFKDALKSIQKALKISPNDPECLNTLGNIQSDLGQEVQAMRAYRKSLKAAPNYLNASQNLGELLLRRHDPIDAIDVFQNALDNHKDNQGLLRGLLIALKEANQTETALELLSRIQRSAAMSLTVGHILTAANRFDEAKQAFQHAMSFEPNLSPAFESLAQLYWLQDGEEGVRTFLEGVLKSNANVGILVILSAKIFRQIGDDDKAMALLAECETRFGAHPEIHSARAEVMIERGQGEAAFAETEAALRLQPGNLRHVSPHARAALMTGKAKLALTVCKMAQTADPKNQYWIAMEATALRALGQPYEHLFNYKDHVLAFDIEVPAEYNSMDDFMADLKSALEETHTTNFHPLGQSPRGGTQSTYDLRFVENKVIQTFFKALNTPIKSYMKSIGTAQGHPMTARNSGKFALSGAWSVSLREGGHHVNHVHPRGWISSAFYVDVPEDIENAKDKEGWIKFGEPPFAVKGLEPEHYIAPKKGRLVLFPSYMWHGTVPITGDATRMTLPFDVVPA
jgi:uncharacterized protein (TIGR02466 family)